jgi:hypothetical protein
MRRTIMPVTMITTIPLYYDGPEADLPTGRWVAFYGDFLSFGNFMMILDELEPVSARKADYLCDDDVQRCLKRVA